jgi:hypothetical protein
LSTIAVREDGKPNACAGLPGRYGNCVIPPNRLTDAPMPRRFHAPALTEIAVVLIVVGLSLGGVLATQERAASPASRPRPVAVLKPDSALANPADARRQAGETWQAALHRPHDAPRPERATCLRAPPATRCADLAHQSPRTPGR